MKHVQQFLAQTPIVQHLISNGKCCWLIFFSCCSLVVVSAQHLNCNEKKCEKPTNEKKTHYKKQAKEHKKNKDSVRMNRIWRYRK